MKKFMFVAAMLLMGVMANAQDCKTCQKKTDAQSQCTKCKDSKKCDDKSCGKECDKKSCKKECDKKSCKKNSCDKKSCKKNNKKVDATTGATK